MKRGFEPASAMGPTELSTQYRAEVTNAIDWAADLMLSSRLDKPLWAFVSRVHHSAVFKRLITQLSWVVYLSLIVACRFPPRPYRNVAHVKSDTSSATPFDRSPNRVGVGIRVGIGRDTGRSSTSGLG